jgi:hypothetical protein
MDLDGLFGVKGRKRKYISAINYAPDLLIQQKYMMLPSFPQRRESKLSSNCIAFINIDMSVTGSATFLLRGTKVAFRDVGMTTLEVHNNQSPTL